MMIILKIHVTVC